MTEKNLVKQPLCVGRVAVDQMRQVLDELLFKLRGVRLYNSTVSPTSKTIQKEAEK